VVKTSLLALILAFAAQAHEVITTKLTYSREVARVLYPRCGGCHRPEGQAFSLLTYAEARPWAKAIQEAVLRRQMPPWNAVKGFGEFRNDRGLSQEEIHIISDWVEGGAPEGDPALLPPTPPAPKPETPRRLSGLKLTRSTKLTAPLRLDTILIRKLPAGAAFKLSATAPNGLRTPLLWIEDYSPKAQSLFALREPITLSPGTLLELLSDSPAELELTAPQRAH
jgi:hypothetical protein